MSDLIDREKAIEDLQNGDPSELYDIEDIKYWINSLPSAEKAQLSKEGTTFDIPSAEPKSKQENKRQAIKASDCISRMDAIKSMANAIWRYPNELYTGLNSYEMSEALAKDGLMFLPSAEPERKKGKWIVYESSDGLVRRCTCDQCGHTTHGRQWVNPNFCPNCGADMGGERDETD